MKAVIQQRTTDIAPGHLGMGRLIGNLQRYLIMAEVAAVVVNSMHNYADFHQELTKFSAHSKDLCYIL